MFFWSLLFYQDVVNYFVQVKNSEGIIETTWQDDVTQSDLNTGYNFSFCASEDACVELVFTNFDSNLDENPCWSLSQDGYIIDEGCGSQENQSDVNYYNICNTQIEGYGF